MAKKKDDALPQLGARVTVHEGSAAYAGAVRGTNEDGTLDITIEAGPAMRVLYGVHRRVGDGTGWEAA